jgi:hypothetical protein
MKVFFVVTVARQVEGDIVSVSFEKCFSDLESVKTVQTETGPVQFACQRRIHEIELEQ